MLSWLLTMLRGSKSPDLYESQRERMKTYTYQHSRKQRSITATRSSMVERPRIYRCGPTIPYH